MKWVASVHYSVWFFDWFIISRQTPLLQRQDYLVKKYLLMVPLILFPYIYLFGLIGINLLLSVFEGPIESQIAYYSWISINIAYLAYIIIIPFYNTVVSARGKYTAYQSAKINLIIKGLQIPAYIFHFIIGTLGILASVWGIGIILVAVVIDLITITLSGISSIGCSIRMRKDKILSLPASILMGIGCFVYCVDVVIAAVYFFMARRKNKKSITQSTSDVSGNLPSDIYLNSADPS